MRRRARDLDKAIQRMQSEVDALAEAGPLTPDEYQALAELIADLARLLDDVQEDAT